MLLHYLKIGIRQLMKHRTQTIISIVGIFTGLLCFSVCSYYSRIMNVGNKDLPTYERMAEIRGIGDSGEEHQIGITPKDFYDKIGTGYYEAMAFYYNGSTRVSFEDELFIRTKQTQCNPDYFKVFPTQCVAGSLHSFILSQRVVVVTTDFIKKYCGNKLPIGESIQKENGESYTIIAVIQSYPTGMNYYPESYDLFFPLEENFSFAGNHKLLLKSPKDAERLSQQLVRVNLFPDKQEWTPSIVLESQMEQHFGVELWITVLGLLVLLTSLINFFSFSVGSFANRYKEFSMRNALGGKPGGLFAMLFAEQGIIILLSTFIALAASELLLPWIISELPNEARGELSVNLDLLWQYMGQYFILLLLISAFVASFSAAYVSRQAAVQGMRGGNITGQRHVVRNVLLGFQFFFSLLFIIGISGMQLQMDAYNNRTNAQISMEEKENIVVLNLLDNERIRSDNEAFLKFLHSQQWNDKMACLSSNYSNTYGYTEIRMVSDEYFDLMKVEKHHQLNEPFCYVNQQLKLDMRNDSIPDVFRRNGLMYPVKGTVSLMPESSGMESLAVMPLSPNDRIEKIYLRITPGADRKEVIASLTKEMSKYLPVNEPYEFATLYDEEIGMYFYILLGLFVVCSAICLLITVLGVYGAISIDTLHRQKEVAIRKINGAKLSDIYWIFGKNYLWLFLVSSVLSMAVVLFVLIMGSQHNIILFSYTNPWLWIIPLTVMGAVITCTISWNIYRISRVNPAEIIKNE